VTVRQADLGMFGRFVSFRPLQWSGHVHTSNVWIEGRMLVIIGECIILRFYLVG